METGRESRCQGTSQCGCSDQYRTRFICRDTVCHRICIAVCAKSFKSRIFIYIHMIHTIRKQLLGIFLRSFAAYDHTVDFVTDFSCHLSGLSHKFVGHRMDLATLLFHIDQEVFPVIFVKCFCFLLKLYGLLRTVSHTETTHTAAFADYDSRSLYGQRTKRTFFHADSAETAFVCIKFHKFHMYLFLLYDLLSG